MRKLLAAAALVAASAALAGFGSREGAQDEDRAALIEAAIAASDRPEGDLDRDPRRRPAASLEASGVKPGDRVLDLAAGGGYMTRLYSSIVGPEGHVTAQNSAAFADRVAPAIDALAADRGNVDHMAVAPDALDAEDASYDVATITLSYHDLINAGVTDAMNAEVFRVLKPGGTYFIVDHLAPEGSGREAARSIHRIDKEIVRAEAEAAGFELLAESDVLMVADDPLDVNGREVPGGMTSQFAYVFVKP